MCYEVCTRSRVLWVVWIYGLLLRKWWHYCCVRAVSAGSATAGENTVAVYCYSCGQPGEGLYAAVVLWYICCLSFCVSQKNKRSADPTAPRVSFQPFTRPLPTLGSTNSMHKTTGVTNMIHSNTNIYLEKWQQQKIRHRLQIRILQSYIYIPLYLLQPLRHKTNTSLPPPQLTRDEEDEDLYGDPLPFTD